MEIADNCVVSFDYTLKNDAGDVLDSSREGQPLSYLHGHGNIVPGLEEALKGRSSGDSFSVTVAPEQGYGPRREELTQEVPRSAFRGVDQIEPGMRFQTESTAGPMLVKVTAVTDQTVTVDANHDLAGETLNFEVAVTEVRAATEQELEHGHVHAGGQDH